MTIGLVEPKVIKQRFFMNKNKIIINLAKNKEPYVKVKGKNNETIAITETYKKMQGAKKAAESLKRIVKNAVIVDNTKRG